MRQYVDISENTIFIEIDRHYNDSYLCYFFAFFVEVVVVAVHVLAHAVHPKGAGLVVGFGVAHASAEDGAAVEEAALIPEVGVGNVGGALLPDTTEDGQRRAPLDGGGRAERSGGRA